MNIKNFLLINTVVLALFGTSLASAQSHAKAPEPKSKHAFCHKMKQLSPAQRDKLHLIRKTMHKQMIPLVKERRSLQSQLRGKVATTNVKWDEIASIVERINATNAKMTTLFAKTQFETFKQLGILLPIHGHHRHHLRTFH